ncbi:MAG TPA: tetratricopeptide repeat protein [Pyrinomonadaceae bacterium]|nr:tetratricopeptide repeat protein [Pyrinomonadaceae bacterium]
MNLYFRPSSLLVLLLLSLLLTLPTQTLAQDTQDPERAKALGLLWEESRAEDALPLLANLAKTRPNDGIVMFSYGFALLAHSKLLKDAEARKQGRLEARSYMLKAKELGVTQPLLKNMLDGLPADGGKDEIFSENKEADGLMRDGEMLYVRGNFAEAAQAYERALKVDPKLYEAALFAGDMYFKLDQNDKATQWYAKAIEINPDRETAYRYSATPLLKADKLEEARQKYIEAVIAEPYTRLPWVGLNQWAEKAGVQLSHPRVDIPTSITAMKDNKMSINLDPKLVGDKADETGLGAWAFYGIARAAWNTTEFAKAYPNEKTYRHSLREETEALKGVVDLVKQQQKEKKIKQLDPSLANLVKLSDDGLLEPYILYAKVDEGISQDYPTYRKANRDKLRRYLVEYVTTNR